MKSLILSTATRFLIGLMLVFSVYLLLRGHNEPGGGFVGSLVAAIAFALYTISEGPQAVRRAVRIDPRTMIMVGLAAALASGFLALLVGAPLFTGVWADVPLGDGSIKLGSPILFDIGVYLTVLGAVLMLILAMEAET